MMMTPTRQKQPRRGYHAVQAFLNRVPVLCTGRRINPSIDVYRWTSSMCIISGSTKETPAPPMLQDALIAFIEVDTGLVQGVFGTGARTTRPGNSIIGHPATAHSSHQSRGYPRTHGSPEEQAGMNTLRPTQLERRLRCAALPISGILSRHSILGAATPITPM